MAMAPFGLFMLLKFEKDQDKSAKVDLIGIEGTVPATAHIIVVQNSDDSIWVGFGGKSWIDPVLQYWRRLRFVYSKRDGLVWPIIGKESFPILTLLRWQPTERSANERQQDSIEHLNN